MSRVAIKAVTACVLLLGIWSGVEASSRAKMVVEREDPESRVQFVSDAPLEKITGVGHALTGDIELDPTAVQSTKGKLELEVASIRTNIELRDQHLRGPDWLDAAKYPKIKFEIKKVSGADTLPPNKPVELEVLGKLSMHGVTRDERARATVRWIPGEGVRVQAEFKVSLPEYKVAVPALVRLKVSDQIALNVMLRVKAR